MVCCGRGRQWCVVLSVTWSYSGSGYESVLRCRVFFMLLVKREGFSGAVVSVTCYRVVIFALYSHVFCCFLFCVWLLVWVVVVRVLAILF